MMKPFTAFAFVLIPAGENKSESLSRLFLSRLSCSDLITPREVDASPIPEKLFYRRNLQFASDEMEFQAPKLLFYNPQYDYAVWKPELKNLQQLTPPHSPKIELTKTPKI